MTLRSDRARTTARRAAAPPTLTLTAALTLQGRERVASRATQVTLQTLHRRLGRLIQRASKGAPDLGGVMNNRGRVFQSDRRHAVGKENAGLSPNFWTQFWTQTPCNRAIRAVTRGNITAEQGPELRIKQHSAILGSTKPFNFQDRCLKPLGHPSNAVKSKT
jgi:hypothetical protein